MLTANTSLGDDIASLSLRYSLCNDTSHTRADFKVKNNFVPNELIDRELRFATVVAMFALKLKQSQYISNTIDWPFIKSAALEVADKTNYLQNEFLKLLDNAEKIYGARKKKRLF